MAALAAELRILLRVKSNSEIHFRRNESEAQQDLFWEVCNVLNQYWPSE